VIFLSPFLRARGCVYLQRLKYYGPTFLPSRTSPVFPPPYSNDFPLFLWFVLDFRISLSDEHPLPFEPFI